MSQSSNSVIGIILPVVLAALIGTIFLGNIMGEVSGETGTRAVIDDRKEMQKLILYDAMIAYGCDTGGWLDLDGDKYWGDHKTLMEYADDPETISFKDLNSSMPRVFKGLPCYGTGSTLSGTGTYAENNPYVPVSKEWRDDQEGRYSRINFEINESFTLPKCFIHDTAKNSVGTGGGGLSGDQYEERNQDNQVTNSWFMMSEQDQHSVFLRGTGWSANSGFQCERIVGSGNKNPNNHGENDGGGPAMNVEVLDTTAGSSLSTTGSTNVNGVNAGGFAGGFTDNIEITSFEFEAETKGYIQTNVGCTNQNPTHSIADPPGLSDKEIKSDECDNKLHPFIVITSTG